MKFHSFPMGFSLLHRQTVLLNHYSSVNELHVTMNNTDKCGSSSVFSEGDIGSLLLKGLQTKDRKLLRSVLCEKDEKVISVAIQHVPPHLIPILVKNLSELFKKQTLHTEPLFLWFRCLSQTHETLVLENPSFISIFQSLLNVIDRRILLQTRLNELKGRLDLLIHQAESSAEDRTSYQQSTLIFNDDVEEFETNSNNDDVLQWNGEYTDEEIEVDDDTDT